MLRACVQILEELALTMDQFIDLCILSGCDYCDPIKGAHPLSCPGPLAPLFPPWNA